MAANYGKWLVERSLDEGGQAHVYVVRERDSDKQDLFALKRLRSSKRIDRFKAEVDAMNRLNHGNIVQVVDQDLETEKPWYVMKFYEDGNLSNYVRNNPHLTPLERLDAFNQVCEAVIAAHQEGVIHRDIKPENILVEGSSFRFMLSDFGIVHVDNQEMLTIGFEQLGAKNYIAPELEHGDIPTRRADIYSLGKLLFFIFSAKVLPGYKIRGERDYAKNLTDVDPMLVMVVDLIERMISENRDNRPEEVTDVRNEIRNVITVFSRNYNVPAPGAPRHCVYCGVGFYELIANKREDFHGLTGMQIHDERKAAIFRCNRCGNMQLFYTYDLKRTNWWEQEGN